MCVSLLLTQTTTKFVNLQRSTAQNEETDDPHARRRDGFHRSGRYVRAGHHQEVRNHQEVQKGKDHQDHHGHDQDWWRPLSGFLFSFAGKPRSTTAAARHSSKFLKLLYFPPVSPFPQMNWF